MLSGWGEWISESASQIATVATETVNEIIAEGKQELQKGNNKSSSSADSDKKVDVIKSLWDPLSSSSSSQDSQNNNNNNNTFWVENPMQWSCLIKGIARDLNTFLISPVVALEHEETKERIAKLLLDSSSSSFPSDSTTTTAASAASSSATATEKSPTAISSSVHFSQQAPTLSNESIRKMVAEDEALAELRFDLVPRWEKEDDFWNNFSWRVNLLSKTSNIEEAIEIVKFVNTEHRETEAATTTSEIMTDVVEKEEKEEEKEGEENKNEEQQQAESLTITTSSKQPVDDEIVSDIISSPKSILRQLLASPESRSPRAPFADKLKKRGFGQRVPDEHLWKELGEQVHATGETELWQNHFVDRSKKELANVKSSVSMLEKLISEVDEWVVSVKKQVENQEEEGKEGEQQQQTTTTTTTTPSLELVQSIAESCKYHKGRVAALLGELLSSPPERVVDNNLLDPDNGVLTQQLQTANKKLADVLVSQIEAMKKFNEFLAIVAEHQKETEEQEQDAKRSGSSTSSSNVNSNKKKNNKTENSSPKQEMKSENDEEQEQQANNSSSSPSSAEPSPSPSKKSETSPGQTVFTATLPWDDEDDE